MRYLSSAPFSAPTTNKPMDTALYEIAVGLRCPICYQKFTDAQAHGEGPKHECRTDS